MGESKPERKQVTRINSTVDSELEREFRETVYKVYGFKKGNLQIGLEEALDAWINKKKELLRKERGKRE